MMTKKRHNSAYGWFASTLDGDAYVAGGGCIILCLSESSDGEDEDYFTSSSSESEFEHDWIDPLWVVDENEVLDRQEWEAKQARLAQQKQQRQQQHERSNDLPPSSTCRERRPPQPSSSASSSSPSSSSSRPSLPASSPSVTVSRPLMNSESVVSTRKRAERVELDLGQERMCASDGVLAHEATGDRRKTVSVTDSGGGCCVKESRRSRVKPIRISGSYAKLHIFDTSSSSSSSSSSATSSSAFNELARGADEQMEDSVESLHKQTITDQSGGSGSSQLRRKHSLGKLLSLPFRRSTLPAPWVAPTVTTTSPSPSSSPSSSPSGTSSSSSSSSSSPSSHSGSHTTIMEASIASSSLLSPRVAVRSAPATFGFSLSSRKKRSMSLRPQSVSLFQELLHDSNGGAFRSFKDMDDSDALASPVSGADLCSASGEHHSVGHRSRSKSGSGNSLAYSSTPSSSSGGAGGTVRSFTRTVKTSLPDLPFGSKKGS